MRLRRSHLLLIACLFSSAVNAFDFFGQGGNAGGFGGAGFPGSGFYRPRGPVDNEEYYQILGIPKTCTLPEIKKAYRRLVVKMHPDKGGDEDKFKELQAAYEILVDPQKRKLYDTYGKAGIEMGSSGGGGGMGAEEVFNQFFRGRASAGPRRAPNLYLQVELSLEDLFKGTTRKIRLNKQKMLEKRIVLEPKILEATFEKGMKDGSRVVLAGEAEGLGGSTNAAPGDIIIEVRELRHPVFTRRNADLLTDVKISLTEALTGFERPLRHLDGRQLWLKGRPGQVTKPGSVWVLEGEGMPIQGEPSSRGRLFLRFTIDFPASLSSLSAEQVEALKKLLPKAPTFTKATNAEDAPDLKAGNPRSFGAVGAGSRGDEEDDDDEWGGGRGGMPGAEQVQCSQQ